MDELTAICRYLEAKIAREREERGYRFYLTDALYAIANRRMGLMVTKQYRDMINPQPEIEEDPEEIIERIRAKLGG